MKTQSDEFKSVELADVELDGVSGGRVPRPGNELERGYLNWIKQIYAPWSNINFGGGRTMMA